MFIGKITKDVNFGKTNKIIANLMAEYVDGAGLLSYSWNWEAKWLWAISILGLGDINGKSSHLYSIIYLVILTYL